MPAWAKAFLAVAVALVPGGFVALFAFAAFRVLHHGWQEAQARANGGHVPVREVLASVHLRDIVREARGAL